MSSLPWDDDILRALRIRGLSRQDTVYVHSDVRAFIVRVESREAAIGQLDWINTTLLCAAAEVVMPTFNFDFAQGITYDPAQTPSRMGVLTERFRQSGTWRTAHPMFSHSCNERSSAFLQTDNDAFGQHSVFGVLHRLGGKIVCLGVPFWKCCSFVHYVEQCWGVPYRTMKYFTGKVVVDGKEEWRTCSHFARPLDGSVNADFRELERRLRDSGAMRTMIVGQSEITCVSADDVYKTAWAMLDDDPYSLIEKRIA